MKKKNIARIAVYPVLVIVVILIFRPVTGSTAHHQIKEELKNEILTAYFWELESGARLVRPLSWIEITGERYTDGRYQPAIHFDPAGEDIRVMTGKNSWIVYEIHLDKLGGARMNSVFIEQSRYPPKKPISQPVDGGTTDTAAARLTFTEMLTTLIPISAPLTAVSVPHLDDLQNKMILANVALPTFFGHGVFLLLGLLPIALIEGFILQKKIERITWKRAFNLALQANFKSTIIGIPCAWLSSLLISIPFGYIIGKVNPDWGGNFGVVAGHAFLLGGFIHFNPTLSLAASTALLIPYYYMSVYIEFGSIQKKLNGDRRDDIKSAVILMNRITYSILASASLVLIFST